MADRTHILRAIRRQRNRRLMRSLLATKLYVPSAERSKNQTVELGLERLTQEHLDDRLVRNNGGISEPEFRLAPTIAYVSQILSPNIRCAH
jgi:hypothetical protein